MWDSNPQPHTITRAGTTNFRIAQVSTTGGLTLKAAPLSGGHAATNGGGSPSPVPGCIG